MSIHIEAMGGRKRIDTLSALSATGEMEIAGRRLSFNLIAARPNRLRVETHDGTRVLVQGTNGVDPAWELDQRGTPKYRIMPETVARMFVADAEFDNPVIAGIGRGFKFDLAG